MLIRGESRVIMARERRTAADLSFAALLKMTAVFVFVVSHPFDRKKSHGHPTDEDLSAGTPKGWGTGVASVPM